MTTAEKAAFAAELEQWINAHPDFTMQSFTDWIEQKLRDLYRALLVATFVEFVWEGIRNGSGPLSARCAVVADEFSARSQPTDLEFSGS